MRRIWIAFIATCLLVSSVGAQMQGVPLDTALRTAMNDINKRLGTEYTYDGGKVQWYYEELRVEGNGLGCPVVADTNKTMYLATVVQFDLQFDDIYEWEYRFAYQANGSLLMVICDTPPGGTRIDSPDSTPRPTHTPTPTDTPTSTPTITPTAPPILIGRDGPRVLPPIVCDGLPTRLVVGSTGRVIVGDVSNNVRHAPSVDGAHIYDLFPGAVFTVVDGPVCVDGYPWYAIETDGELRGWTAEGRRNDYFVEPVLTNAALILPANAATLRPTGLPFGAGTIGISMIHAGYFVSFDADSAQVWTLPQNTFTTLDEGQWQPSGPEIFGSFNYVHRDYLGRIWLSNAQTGTLESVDQPGIAPFQQPVAGGEPIISMDMESNFIAVPGPNPNTIAVYAVDANGGGNVQVATLALNGGLRDVVLAPDGMTLYAATDTEISVYRNELGTGWQTMPLSVFTHDLPNPKLATSLDGQTVAVTGTRTDGIPGLRVYYVAFGATVSVRAGAAVNGLPGTSWSAPAVSPEASLVAVSATNGTTRVIDSNTGAVLVELPTGGFGPVAFATNGLQLLVPSVNQQLQMYGVEIPPQPDATPGPTSAPMVVTATPTFGPMVVTATPTSGPMVVTATPSTAPIVVTATPTTDPTLPPPTAP